MSGTVLGAGDEAFSKREDLVLDQVPALPSNKRIRSCAWKYVPNRSLSLVLSKWKVLAALLIKT